LVLSEGSLSRENQVSSCTAGGRGFGVGDGSQLTLRKKRSVREWPWQAGGEDREGENSTWVVSE